MEMIYNMQKRIKKLIQMCLIMGAILLLPLCCVEAQNDNRTKIHFISLSSTTDAILLESNGHYGMVDSGEDWDYPDGTDERYPLRSGITKGIGFEQQVIRYLKMVGVEKLDFYIATHSHSDHIGSGDEILDAFPTEKLYINEYKDEYIRDENRKWDNRYVYDSIIESAKRNGTQIISDLETNAENCFLSLGDMSLELMNVEHNRDENGQVMSVADENDNSIVTKVTAYGWTALLTADLDPTEGDTRKVADQLIEELWSEEQYQQEDSLSKTIELQKNYSSINYAAKSDVDLDLPETRIETPEIDESKKNSGKTISIDLMKMLHHSIDFNNTTYFLTSLNPKTVVITGYESWFNAREKDCLPHSEMYATASDSAAVVATFNENGITTKYEKIEAGWLDLNGSKYYFDENGRVFTDGKAYMVDGEVLCFDERGALKTENCWVKVEGKWRYWLAERKYQTESWLQDSGRWYYLDKNGDAVTGWKQFGTKWYYFMPDSSMAVDTWIGDYYVNKSGEWEPNTKRDKWIKSGEHWWYCHADGSYTKSNWEYIEKKWYYFDKSGWMVTGWCWVNGKCYYLASNGAMVSDTWIGDYYVNKSGEWEPNAKRDKWIKSGERWWYCHADGSYTKSNWEYIEKKWYYFDKSGWMVTGWCWVNGKCYYLASNGAMVSDTWIGDYYVNKSGEWEPNAKRDKWIKSRNS